MLFTIHTCPHMPLSSFTFNQLVTKNTPNQLVVTIIQPAGDGYFLNQLAEVKFSTSWWGVITLPAGAERYACCSFSITRPYLLFPHQLAKIYFSTSWRMFAIFHQLVRIVCHLLADQVAHFWELK